MSAEIKAETYHLSVYTDEEEQICEQVYISSSAFDPTLDKDMKARDGLFEYLTSVLT